MQTEKVKPNQYSIDFMLEEFRYLKASYEGAMAWRDERFKSFINIVFGSVALLTIIAQFSKSSTILVYSLILITLILYLYGLFVFSRLVAGFLSVARIERAINRVRTYFIEMDDGLKEYVELPAHPSKSASAKPRLGTGLLGITALTNALIAGVFGASVSLEVFKWIPLLSVGVGFLLALASWGMHVVTLRKQNKKDRDKDLV
ncbi:MAG: hypothetical protein HPY85_13265 [Anaerolineae bacterium]|nr:hypothetical protein [Anaerolineae bacterium]